MGKFLKLFFYSLLLFSSLGCKSNPQSGDSIKLGAVLSLTGPAGEQGGNILSGIQLAVEELNSQGMSVTLYTENDETVAAKTVSSLLKLIQTDGVQATIGGTWDYLGEAAYPVAERLNVPFVTVTNPVEILSDGAKNSKWIFTSSLSLAEEGKAIEDLLSKKKPKTLGLVFPNIPWGDYRADLLRNIAAKLKISVIQEYRYGEDGAGADSMRIAAVEIKKKKPELVYAVLDYNTIDRISAELDRLELDPYIVTTQHLDTAIEFSKNPKRLKKFYAIYPSPPSGDFSARYEARFRKKPRVYAAHGYDAAMFLVKALSAGVDLSDKKASFKYEGVTGVFELPSSGRQVSTSNAVVATAESGSFEYLKNQ